MDDDLFSSAAAEHLALTAPLAERLRPKNLDEVVGQEHLLGLGRPLRTLVEADSLGSTILWGPAGTGKTTLARVIARTTARSFVELSAVNASVKDVRGVLAAARQLLGERQRGTILFLDEVHRFNKAQQDALLPGVESGQVILIGATTENPLFEVNAPLLSRCTLFRLEALGDAALQALLERGAAMLGVSVSPDAAGHLVHVCGGDARQMLTTLDVAAALAVSSGRTSLEIEDAEGACQVRVLGYGRDAHYDVISAFIKSIRGSDVDAGLYWLSRMLDAGEDPRFIARRLVILASEDIGMADPQSLLVAVAAASAVDRVGLPEAGLNLAQAVVHLANAEKSNSVTVALARARIATSRGEMPDVPPHLRDGHHPGSDAIGHGTGYKYPHDYPGGFVEQSYRPDEAGRDTYWTPTGRGSDCMTRRPESEDRVQGEDPPAR